MNTMRRLLLLTLWLTAAVVAISPAEAAADPATTSAVQLAQSDGPTLSQAVEMVRRRCNCRIVSAETRVRGNREVHVIKVLTKDGNVRTETIPGRSRQGRG